jgi:mono/diheme cytochrome c family protein
MIGRPWIIAHIDRAANKTGLLRRTSTTRRLVRRYAPSVLEERSMKIGVAQQLSIGLAAALCAAVGLAAQAPATPPAAQAPAAPSPAARPPIGRPVVDMAAHDRGRALWATHCIDCHGAQARGSDTGPNIIRTRTANFDRFAAPAGSVLGPFLKAGHPTQSKKPSASFTDEEIVALANFLRQRINDTMRGSPVFTEGDIVVGDAKAGEAFFNGEGRCARCHTGERSLAGIATRIPTPVDLQQRMLFPGSAGRGRGRPRGGAPAGAAPDRNAVTVSIATGPGAPLSGVLVEESDFYVTLREADGTIRTVKRAPGTKITKRNPLQAHIDLLDRISDAQVHDVVGYLETLK